MHLLLLRTKKRLQAHCNGIEIRLRGTISIKSARERSPVRKQIRIPPQPAWPKGCKHTAMALRFDYVVQSLSRAQERDHPCGNKSKCHRGTPVLLLDRFHWRQLFAILKSLIILSILDGSGHLYGIHTEMVYTYTDTCYILTGCFLNS